MPDTTIQPYKFTTSIQFTSRGEAERKLVIKQVRVTRCVAIEPDGTFSDKITTPFVRPWFHLECVGINTPIGATFDLISDGFEWLPAERYGTKKLTNKLKPKKSIDLNKLSTIDQELIQVAIHDFINGKSSKHIKSPGVQPGAIPE